MHKKEKVSLYLIEMEKMLHKLIDEKRDKGFTAFELIAISVDCSIKNQMKIKGENYEEIF